MTKTIMIDKKNKSTLNFKGGVVFHSASPPPLIYIFSKIKSGKGLSGQKIISGKVHIKIENV